MNELSNKVSAFVESMASLADLIPGRALVEYLFTCFKRLIDPYLSRYEQIAAAKTQEKLFRDYPLKRLEILKELSVDNPIIPEASLESFENAFRIAEYCLKYINGDNSKHCVDSPLDQEWLNRFVDEAEYISDEKLQQLFGRLLKEKIYNPDSVNKRVLNIISNIDASELEAIQQYMPWFLSDAIPTDVVYEFDNGIEILMDLQDIGLVNLANAPDVTRFIERKFRICQGEDTIDFNGGQFVFSEVRETFEIGFKSYFLTKEGEVVHNLVAGPMNDDVVQMYQRIFESKCAGKAKLTIRKY